MIEAEWVSRVKFDLIDSISTFYKLPKNLLTAIVMKESSWQPNAVRYEPNYAWVCDVKTFAKKNNSSEQTEQMLQMTSWGYCQVMGAVAREYGFQGWLTELVNPELNLKYGARHLKNYLTKHPGGINDAISAYNQGSPRKDPRGRYLNQAYVDSVLQFKAQIDKKIDTSEKVP